MLGSPGIPPGLGERAARLSVWASLGAVLAVAVGAGVWSLARAPGGQPAASVLQVVGDYGVVPDFGLTERSGRTVTRRDLAGRFWVADFVFTRCTGLCPLLTTRMAMLAREVSSVPGAGDIRFVSFSVDPTWDTPERLARHADGLGSVDPRWLFLTGPRDDLYRLIGEGFRLSVAERAPDAAAGELITHSDRFVLVDPRGTIRGYYHGSDEGSVKALAGDLERLARASAR